MRRAVLPSRFLMSTWPSSGGHPGQIEWPAAANIVVDEPAGEDHARYHRPGSAHRVFHTPQCQTDWSQYGFYADREIPESVIDEFGRRFVYAGVAPRKFNGAFDVDALAAGEVIVRPGLVYRRVGAKTSWWQSLLPTGYVGEQPEIRSV
jgi:hypothetical protein